MKKLSLLCTVLAALMLTSCAENNEELTSAVPTETTSLTLTVSLTEPEPLPEPVPYLVEFAVYDPFADAVKVENSVRKELAEAVEKISDARGFLSASSSCFYGKSQYHMNYADMDNILERNEKDEYDYCPLNKDIAQTEEELTQYIRSCFTEDYISDDEMQKTLFEAVNERVPAEYKTIDGILCMRQQYLGVAPDIQFDKFSVLSYDGTSAKVAAYGESAAYPPYMIFMEIVKSEEYGWRLDGIELKECWQDEAEVLYNAVTLRTETLNKILDGGNAPENAKTIEIDGETYTQTDLDMTLPEMLGFFEEMFHGKYNAKKYITEVYAERDGVLYRKNSAPRWYLPEMQLDPCYGVISAGGSFDDMELTCEQEFYDSITDESFTQKIRVVYSCDYLGFNTKERRNEYEYEYIHITSELPIRERGSDETSDEIIKPVIEKKKTELDISDDPFGVTDIYSGTMFDYNNDGHDDYVIAYGLYAQFQLVIIDSQNGDILFDNRIMTNLLPSTELEIYRNSNSEYALKITERVEKPVVHNILETIQIITASEECIFEAVYDYETGDFYKGYAYYAYNEYTQEEYIQKQEELLNGYKHYANTEWSEY